MAKPVAIALHRPRVMREATADQGSTRRRRRAAIAGLGVLGLLDGLEAAIPAPAPSPIDQLRRRGKERMRASRQIERDDRQPELFSWGDEQEGGR